jgi:hypothetical protein
VSKSRRPSRRPSASSKRKPAARPPSGRKKGPRKSAVVEGVVYLKPIRDDIQRALEGLRAIQKESAKKASESVQQCLMIFDSICAAEPPDGCGSDMAFWP